MLSLGVPLKDKVLFGNTWIKSHVNYSILKESHVNYSILKASYLLGQKLFECID